MFASLRINLVLLITLFFSLALASASVSSPSYEISLDDGTAMMSAPVNHMMARATTSTTLCATLTINLQSNGATTGNIRPIHCYCNYNGVLTNATTTDINTAFAVGSTQINQTNFQTFLTTNDETRAQGIASITSSITSALNSKTTTCTYAANTIPNSCTACTFTCPANYKVCGSACIATTATCQSGSVTKREYQRKRCANGFEMCATGMLGFGGKAAGWECVNTEADLESCGGCQVPMDGGKQGQDCTAIPGADEIACLQGGCKVNSCLRGFKLVDNACIPSTAAEDQMTSYSRRSRATGIPARHRR